MPHTSTAKKRMRQDEKRRINNRSIIKSIKTQVKRVQSTAESGTVEELKKEYDLAAKRLDKAAAKRTIHPNLAARKKAQLARLVNTKKAAKQPSS